MPLILGWMASGGLKLLSAEVAEALPPASVVMCKVTVAACWGVRVGMLRRLAGAAAMKPAILPGM